MRQKLMMIGMGDLAWWTLEILLRTPGFPEHVDVLAADYNEEAGLRRVNSALLSASQTCTPGNVTFRSIDALHIEETAAVIADFSPDVIFDSTSLQSWSVLASMPEEKYLLIDKARFGPWIPMHCAVTHKIMQAVRVSGTKPMVINCGFPDVTNCALGKIGMAPDVGIGNIDNMVAPVRMMIAEREKVSFESVRTYQFFSHFLSYYVGRFHETAGAPFILRVFVDDVDLSAKYDPGELLCEASRRFRRQGGTNAHSVVGASAAKNILHVLGDKRSVTHSPGPCGLPGGYPVRIGSKKVEVALPPGLSLGEAVAVNEACNRFDGVERIGDDGTVFVTDESYEIMKNLLGYDCKAMRIEEAEDWARELRAKFKEWAAKPLDEATVGV